MHIERRHRRLAQFALTGVDGSRTRLALALAGGLCVFTAVLRGLAPSEPGVGLTYTVLHLFTLTAVPASIPAEGVGLLTLTALAGGHGYLNEGYVPSLVLAGAPGYGNYLVNGPGVAPVWAATFVLPYVLAGGTVGFLVGVGLRRLRTRGGLPTGGPPSPE